MKINPSTSNTRRKVGFTLLEMVIVLGIIGIILGGIGYKMVGALESARYKTVTGDFKSMDSMLMQYKLNGGHYPTTSQGLKALVTKPSGTPVPRIWVQQIRDVPLDPWGGEYGYRFPGKKRANEYEIICKGPDGMENTPDDLSSQDD
ncbi:MAG: type II secretion system major pseudopilin GspG [Verrucomicrobiota bacterium]